MKVAIRFFIIVCSFAMQATAQEIKSSYDFELLKYGHRRNNAIEDAETIIADRWKISFKRVASYIITQQLKDSADAFNRRSDSLIALKYGKHWKRTFELEIDLEIKLIEKLISRVKSMHCILQLDSTLVKKDYQAYYMTIPYSTSRNEKYYEIFVYSTGTINEKTAVVCYYIFKLHKRRKKIELVSDKPYFLFKES